MKRRIPMHVCGKVQLALPILLLLLLLLSHPCATCSVSSSSSPNLLVPIFHLDPWHRSVPPRFHALRFVSQRLHDPPPSQKKKKFPNHAISCHHRVHGHSNQLRCGEVSEVSFLLRVPLLLLPGTVFPKFFSHAQPFP